VREDVEHNRLVNDTLLCSGYLISKNIDVVPDLPWEIEKLLSRDLLKYSPRLGVFILEMV
jgi:hypothetical protein